jgi:penicillin-binding protein 1A
MSQSDHPSNGPKPFILSVDPEDRLTSSDEVRTPNHRPAGASHRPGWRLPWFFARGHGATRPSPSRANRPPSPPRPSSPNGRPRRSLGRRLILWAVTLAIWAGIALAGLVGYYAIDLPDIDKVTAIPRRPSVVMEASNGETFAAFGDIYGEHLDIDQMSPYLPEAVVAIEDRRFYHHFGIDLIGLARAVVANLRAGHTVQGGSTITQQLAKNLFLTPDRTLKRKVQEALMALWLEHRFTKQQILSLYLNRVYLGSGTYGVDAAAKRYFNVSARKVSLYQAALIAGLLKAPSRYSPLNDPEASHQRTVDVLHAMVAAGFVDQKSADLAGLMGAAELVQRPRPAGRYFADWIMSQLDGMSEIQGKDIVVKTTLDLGLERTSESDLTALIDGPGAKANVSQGAVVVLTPDGAVRAMVGGKDYDDSQFNRATQGQRQPGSSFKPFVYLTAMERGYTPDDTMEDAPIRLGGWAPGNFNHRYEGMVTLRHAFAESLNTVAVRVIEAVGPARVIATAHRLGITSDLHDDASLALGTSEVTPLEMTTAYATFANGGNGVVAYGIAEIDDPNGHVLYRREGGGLGQVIAPTPLARMQDIMSAVIREGSGRNARLDRPAAGKTGTTQDYRDAWFVGFTADYVAGVWLGNDDQRNAMKRVTGGSLPAQLWREVMTAAHQGLPPRPLYLPEQPSALAGVGDAIGRTANAAADAASSAANGIGDTIGNLIDSLFGKH